ncbi:hypothetical protein [Nesterenkonia populi]
MRPLAALEALPFPDLEEAVVFAEWGRLRAVSSRSLRRTRQLMRVLRYDPGLVQHPVIGVVGSKGKGTASAYASAALAGLGHHVGTVMSPGILSNADRIRIDGRVVEESTRRRALLRLEEARRKLPEATAESGYLAPTGLFLLMGMLIFQEAGTEAAVVEAGIGGASDDLSHWPLDGVVLTRVFGEHLDLLGPTVADVARDKTGVISERTRFCVSLAQSDDAEEAVRQAGAATTLLRVSSEARSLVCHLPSGFQRENAAAGVTAALQLSRGILGHEDASSPPMMREGGKDEPESTIRGEALPALLRSVSYPGRLSVHDVPGGRCVIDSAVSGEGLASGLDFARGELGDVDQVLVCLPPGKDLEGFTRTLGPFGGERRFVELPGAYTGTPDREAWRWEWVRLEDLGEAVHEAPGSAQLQEILRGRRTLLAGTVLFTSLALRTLGADVGRLFPSPR